MNDYIAYCGLDCETCEARLATVRNDDELRKKVSKEWSELNGVEITPEMINCSGCRIPGPKTVYCDSLCPIRQCAGEKQVETCGACPEMKSCKKVGAIIGNNPDARERLISACPAQMSADKKTEILGKQLSAFLEEDPFYVPALANASALLWESLEDINWAGFYLVRNGMLVLGPFQGRPACIHIERGKGVCGTAWEKDSTLVVADVHEFPGHIACDAASRSEIVVPIHCNGNIAAVLDIDSPLYSRFGDHEKQLLEEFVLILEQQIRWK